MGVPAMDGVPPGAHPGVPGQMPDMSGVGGMAPPEQQHVDGQMAQMGAPQMGGPPMGAPQMGAPPGYEGMV